jgi:hypothetical protein
MEDNKMRKIEQQMIKAIMNGKNWANGNTMVAVVKDGMREDAYVYLHGNHIATVLDCLPLELEVNVNTLAEYPTNTTKSRLRALGADVCTRKGITYLDGVAV